MIGDVMIRSGPDYGPFRSGGPFGAAIHDLECPREVNVSSLAGPNSYTQNAGVSPHTMSDMKKVVQLLAEDHAGAHLGPYGNPLLVGFEVTGYAKWTKAEWMADISNLLNQARAVANLWRRMGWKASDLRWGSIAELREAKRRYNAGLPCVAPRLWTHNDVSEAGPGTNHWDPGTGFPFAEFAKWCLQYLIGKDAAVSPGTSPNIPDTPGPGGAQIPVVEDDFLMALPQYAQEETHNAAVDINNRTDEMDKKLDSVIRLLTVQSEDPRFNGMPYPKATHDAVGAVIGMLGAQQSATGQIDVVALADRIKQNLAPEIAVELGRRLVS